MNRLIGMAIRAIVEMLAGCASDQQARRDGSNPNDPAPNDPAARRRAKQSARDMNRKIGMLRRMSRWMR